MVDQLRDGLHQTVVASIGPTTTQMLEECDIHVDFEPSHPKMGHLVSEAAAARCHPSQNEINMRVHSADGKTAPTRIK